jgi:hypothetical protein
LSTVFEGLDHVVVATPDLAETIGEIGDVLGVTPSEGGRHPAWGTRNALLALGPRMYLEIVGPDFDQPSPPRPRPFDLDRLDHPRLVTWACRADDLDSLIRRARQAGIELGDVHAGSRRRPDGSTLSWNMTDLTMPREGGVVPFFITWGGSDHPAQTAPGGCTLEDFRMEHPDPIRLGTILSSLGLEAAILPGDQPRLTARIAGPRGSVDLTSGGTG